MKLIYLVTEDSYFYSHRLPMAQAARDAGLDTAVITNVNTHGAAIEKKDIRVIPLSLERRSLNPFRAVFHILQIAKIYRQEKPGIVHHIGMKPVLYGSIAAWLAGIPHVVNAFAGLGYVFTADDLLARSLRIFLTPAFFILLKRKGSHLLLQNNDDLSLLQQMKVTPDGRTHVIPGSGIDPDEWDAQPYPSEDNTFICVYAGRMIGIKGLQTLKAAFAILAHRAPHIRLWLCGQSDPANPGSWTEEHLREWEHSAVNVVYKGFCPDMKTVWAKAHMAVQPSYGGEGVPRSLLEAAASARPIVATDVPGCRDIVEDGHNGFLIPPHDPAALATAIENLAALAPDSRAEMGAISRELVRRRDMSAASVTEKTRDLYLKLVADKAD